MSSSRTGLSSMEARPDERVPSPPVPPVLVLASAVLEDRGVSSDRDVVLKEDFADTGHNLNAQFETLFCGYLAHWPWEVTIFPGQKMITSH